MLLPAKIIRNKKHRKATNSVSLASITHEMLPERSCKLIAKVETEV